MRYRCQRKSIFRVICHKKGAGLLLPTNNGKTVQIAVTDSRVLAASGIADANITVGGILVVV